MAEAARVETSARPDISHLIQEDDEPLDNWFQERQQRILPDILYASWSIGRPFLAAANVGLFDRVAGAGVAPDVMVSLDVEVPDEWWQEHNRSYLRWEFGKAPEIVIEVVSNRTGGEDEKLLDYARMGVPCVVIYDPRCYLSKRPLRVYLLHGNRYVDLLDPSWIEPLGLGLTLWQGAYMGMTATWLRWCDREGKLLPTATEQTKLEHERAEQANQRAEQANARAERERERAERERERAERLARKLQELGLDEELNP